MATRRYLGETEVGVVGAGIVGLAATYELARRQVDVRCFERAEPGSGQSAGLTRVFRHLHEDGDLIPLAREARECWSEWEGRAGVQLIGREGLLVGAPDPEAARADLERHGVEARLVRGREQAEVLPVFATIEAPVLFEPQAGAIRTRPAVEALSGWIRPHLVRSEVLGIHEGGLRVVLQTSEGLWRCDRVLICAGVSTPEIAASLGMSVPVELRCHARPAFAVRPEHRGRTLACWIDKTAAFGEPLYAGPVEGGERYVVGLSGVSTDKDLPAGSAYVPRDFDMTAHVEAATRCVEKALPGLDPEPLSVRLCHTTSLPWGPDAFAAWRDGPVTLFTGHNLFKLAPVLGRLLGDAVANDRVDPLLEPPRRLSSTG